jgi:hypothetical protein
MPPRSFPAVDLYLLSIGTDGWHSLVSVPVAGENTCLLYGRKNLVMT